MVFACAPNRDTSEAVAIELDQAQLDRFADTLIVKYTVLNNRVKDVCGDSGRCFSVQIDLSVREDFAATGWQMYFSQLFPVHKVESEEFEVETINGDLNRIVPNGNFDGFRASEAKTIIIYLAGTHGNEFEAMPNYYLVGDSLEARIVESTVPIIDPETGLEIMPHLTPFTDAERQFRITDNEKIVWARSSVLFTANEDMYADQSSLKTAIIPTPYFIDIDDGDRVIDLASGVDFQLVGIDRQELDVAIDRLGQFGITESSSGTQIRVKVEPDSSRLAESYELQIGSNEIEITAGDSAGAFYALQTLANLVTLGDTSVPVMTVHDQPRYQYRGMHLDVARNFHSKELVLKLLDQMAAYKFNKFHLDLGNDEGWRLQIPGLPELTEIGSKRCHDPAESRCLLPQLGSGPFADTTVNGYFTVEDYQDILVAAAARHIQVIPSFDMPGHSRSSVKSMEARYRRFMAEGEEAEALRYLLSDPDDASVYSSIQNYTDNTINVCMESSYTFIEKVISELQVMHNQAGQPLTRYHIGADETAGAWRDSPACRRFLSDNDQGIDGVEKLGAYFIERVAGMLSDKGIEPAGWGDGMGHTDPANMPPIVQSNAWGRLIDPAHRGAHKHINHGWDVVNSIPDATYFDFPYEADPKERGYYWASRNLNTRKVFEFMPDNLPAHAEFWSDSEGLDLSLNDALQTGESGEIIHRPIEEGKGFAGVQGHIWSETLRTDEQVEYMVFPRLLALAERAWHVGDWEVPYDHEGASYSPETSHFSSEMRLGRDAEWNRFANVLEGRELAKLDLAGINYRIPTVGAKIMNGKLFCNIIFPGMKIEYRRGEGEWLAYDAPVDIGSETVEVRARSADGIRIGRSLIVQ